MLLETMMQESLKIKDQSATLNTCERQEARARLATVGKSKRQGGGFQPWGKAKGKRAASNPGERQKARGRVSTVGRGKRQEEGFKSRRKAKG